MGGIVSQFFKDSQYTKTKKTGTERVTSIVLELQEQTGII